MSTVEDPPRVRPPAPPAGSPNVVVATLRRSWRQLTSMRTALVLLFLLALAAIPGSLLPQRNVSIERVRDYLAADPGAGRFYDRLWLFDVYASPWFSAIYLLLFLSLVGCLVPRLNSHALALVRVPPDAPQHLDRLPVHASGTAEAGDAEAVTAALAALLRRRRFRVAVRGTTVAAEKGYLKETGNLLFHFALLALLLGVALGSWYGWHGNRLVVAGADRGFCNTLQQYDEYGLGARVGAGDLPPFCVRLDDFRASYSDSAQPLSYHASMTYQLGNGPERAQGVEVNHPLRLPGANVYLLGHGYAPVVRYTDRYGKAQTTVAPFLPSDQLLTSQGVAAFPDVNVNPTTGRQDPDSQVAFAGVYLPTVPPDVSVGHSMHPAERDPRLMLVAYTGDLGLDRGVARSVYSLDQQMVTSGRLKKAGEAHMLRVGESFTLDDRTKVEFLGTRPWVTLSIRHDPGEKVVLVAAGLLLVGLLGSLTGRRRRIWFRVNPQGLSVEAAGLPRSDYPGFAAEFDDLVKAAREERIF
jgi:cytochrome c biogenesis protein